jgi:hypothetical protein
LIKKCVEFNVLCRKGENRRYFATGEAFVRPGLRRRRTLKQTTTEKTQSASTSDSKSPQKEAEEFIERLYSLASDPTILNGDLNKSQSSSHSPSSSDPLFLRVRSFFRFRGPFALRVQFLDFTHTHTHIHSLSFSRNLCLDFLSD